MISVALALWVTAAGGPATPPDAGTQTDDEDAEVLENLDLLQNMPAVENLDLIQTLTDDD